MVRANRPWRLAARLYRALVAAVAAVAFALVTSDVWRIAASLDGVRLVAITVLSIGVTAGSLIAVHGLWQRGGGGRAPDQVAAVQRRDGGDGGARRGPRSTSRCSR